MTTLATEDSDLLRRVLDGEKGALASFADIYYPRLYRFALSRVSGDPEAARDVIHATLLKAARKLAHFRGEAAFFTWLCQICRREILDRSHTERRYRKHVVLIEDFPDVRAIVEALEAADEMGPMRNCERTEVGRLVQSALDRLPAHYGDALEWKYVEGCSVEEIAERLCIGHTAAQSLLARARGGFRIAVENAFGTAVQDIAAALDP